MKLGEIERYGDAVEPSAAARPAAPPAPPAKATAESIVSVRRWADQLFSFRLTRPAAFRFQPGQFARLGVAGERGSIIWRPYSMVSADYDEYLDFFSIVVPDGAFTTRLAKLGPGDTVYVEKQPYGYLTAGRFVGGRDLWMLASGTGVAPFLSILRDPAVWERFEHLVLAYSVRQAADLAYRDEIAALAADPLFAPHGHKLRFVPVVTRERVPGALDRRLTELIADRALERQVGLDFDAEHSRILVCGNPQMVEEVRNLLADRGLRPDLGRAPGNFACENGYC